jgi:hypothetical protein
MRYSTAMKILIWGLLLALVACGDDAPDDACQNLAAVCALCPADGDGPLAAESCNNTVELADNYACQERLDADTYGAQGCR